MPHKTGFHYLISFRIKDHTDRPGYITTVTKTDYGYKVRHMTPFISIQDTKLVINPNGTAKAVTKVNTNYRAPYQYTTYFDNNGMEIIDDNVRKELAIYKKLQI